MSSLLIILCGRSILGQPASPVAVVNQLGELDFTILPLIARKSRCFVSCRACARLEDHLHLAEAKRRLRCVSGQAGIFNGSYSDAMICYISCPTDLNGGVM